MVAGNGQVEVITEKVDREEWVGADIRDPSVAAYRCSMVCCFGVEYVIPEPDWVKPLVSPYYVDASIAGYLEPWKELSVIS